MSDINELQDNMTAEGQPEVIDWDHQEAEGFPPSVKPGSYDFVFSLEAEDAFGSVTIEGRSYLSVTFVAEVIVPGSESKSIRFQRVTNFKHPKMIQSGTTELMKCLGLRTPTNTPTAEDLKAVFSEASGRARGRGKVAWRFYCKDCETTISTSPRRRKQKTSGEKVKDTDWPRSRETGSYEMTVKCPNGHGDPGYGRAEFVKFFAKHAD